MKESDDLAPAAGTTGRAGRVLSGGGFIPVGIAAALLTAPLLWVSGFPVLPWESWSRVVVLWLALGLMGLLVRRPPDVLDTSGRLTAGVLIAAATGVAVVLLWRMSPALTGDIRLDDLVAGGRARGPFGQPNLTASFLATGVLLTTHLLLTSCPTRRAERATLAGFVVAVMAAALTLTFSRTGWLGLWTGLLALSALAGRRAGWRLIVPWYGMAAGWGGVSLLLWLHGGPVREVISVDTPRTQIWHATRALIQAHLWNGIGYGQFAHRFPDGLAMIHQVQTDKSMMLYPHNEVLLWWVEGGLMALVGVLFLVMWGVGLLLRSLRAAGHRGGYGAPGADAPGWLLCMAPVLVHSLLEYPAYQSPLHLLLLILLPALAMRACGAGIPDGVASIGSGRPLPCVPWPTVRRLSVWAVVVGTLWFCATAMLVDAGRIRVNDTGGADGGLLLTAVRLNPWYAPERAGYQLAMHTLYRYNQGRDAPDPVRDHRLLVTAAGYLKRYLAVYPDPNGWGMYLDTLYLSGGAVGFTAALKQARHEVAWDPRFAPGTY
ncbi:O-antigen ligase family protein [Enterobacter asburiae]|uniref:O-antigen ligase family protein n=1 Tax=Enterobacter asburiae TaxID=61645 RepID=UPI000F87C4E3|nr:Wzy polymerase domain-containing protein [Enterobacter asburiae]RTP87922.1 O-antigen ligase family protein [Enterobacter asburiae]